MELPWAASDQPLNLWVAADADPWGSGLAVYRRMGAEYVLAGTIGKPSVMGATLATAFRRDRCGGGMRRTS